MTKVKKKKGAQSIVREYTEAILVAVVLALFLRTFVVQAFKIPSESMMETLLVGDYLLVNKFIYGIKVPFTDKFIVNFKDPKPGEVIVFRYPLDPSRDYIKRCVAVEGDTVTVRDNQLFINGRSIYEYYKLVKSPNNIHSNFGPKEVPEGHIFMMGDNRNNSADSRSWGFLDKKFLRGRALIRYFSWDKERHLPRISRIGSPIIHATDAFSTEHSK
ncbi:MAG: signal peptidase I [Candidatus Cloacimonetes bacterium 4572_55]|nr:MAG: signal peptidase I [Candidatus Cloacimonetes bacterium 4572_55]